MKLTNENGAVPIIIIIAVAIGTALGILGGVVAYMATHAFSALLVSLGLALIFALFVLPNLSSIVRWGKNVKHEIGHSMEEINDEVTQHHQTKNPIHSNDSAETT